MDENKNEAYLLETECIDYEIPHFWDIKAEVVSKKASEVL